MTDLQLIRNWFVLYTHSRCEFKVAESLETIGIITYLPVQKIIRKWSDRKKEITSPLFPSYIFIYATEKERLISIENKEVVRCLTDAGNPSIIPSWQINSLKRMISTQSEIKIIEGTIIGQIVEINSGPFKGIKGTVMNIENKNQLAISIVLLNRTVVTHLPEDSVF